MKWTPVRCTNRLPFALCLSQGLLPSAPTPARWVVGCVATLGNTIDGAHHTGSACWHGTFAREPPAAPSLLLHPPICRAIAAAHCCGRAPPVLAAMSRWGWWPGASDAQRPRLASMLMWRPHPSG